MVELTEHGEERVAKRTGVGKKASQKLADEAFEHGIVRNALSGSLRKYVDFHYNSHNAAYMCVYQGNVFVFNNATDKLLITMYSLPGRLKHRKAAKEVK